MNIAIPKNEAIVLRSLAVRAGAFRPRNPKTYRALVAKGLAGRKWDAANRIYYFITDEGRAFLGVN